MHDYLFAILNERIWKTILDGYTRPIVTVEGNNGPKPVALWTAKELEADKFNSQGLNAIMGHVSEEEFKKISNCTTSKQAWDMLTVIFYGTQTVKSFKIQRCMINFETIMMKEDESFDIFHSKLKDIVNSLYNFGKIIFESRVVNKIIFSSPNRFILKITAIEESKDLDSLTENYRL